MAKIAGSIPAEPTNCILPCNERGDHKLVRCPWCRLRRFIQKVQHVFLLAVGSHNRQVRREIPADRLVENL